MKEIIKRYILWLIVIIFLEGVFIILVNNKISLSSIGNIFLYALIMSAFYSIITYLFKDKANYIITLILLFILGVMFGTQLVLYNTLMTFFSFSILGISDQLNSFIGETLKAIGYNILGIILFMLPFILCLIFHKKISFSRNTRKHYLTYFIIFILTIGIYLININLQKNQEMSIYDLYYKTFNNDLNITKTGVISAYNLDMFHLIVGDKEEEMVINIPEKVVEKVYEPNILELDFNKNTSNSEIKSINQYMLNDLPTFKNEYTAYFDNYNLIYITAESFSEIGVSEELTPTLYKLVNTGFKFTNFYTPNNLSTLGGEFQSVNGLFANNAVMSTWRSGKNYFPYGLGKVFSEKGYKTYAYHDNWYQFQDRHKYLKSIGFTNYLGCGNGLQKRMNCNSWPESDIEMMKVTLPDYLNSEEPFLAYYMTVSGHFQYNFKDNSIAYKNKKYVNNLPYNENVKAYIATQIELDRALEYLLTKLEEANKLDNTVIVLMADHYPYNLSLDKINQVSTYKRDSIVEVNHNALILWNSQLENKEITKVCMSIDVLPTVLNLFNIPYDSRLIIGKDIFSNMSGLAYFSNHSFVTEYGTYFAQNNQFVPKEGMEIDYEYIKEVNNIVNNRMNVSRLIVKTNYYNYLLK